MTSSPEHSGNLCGHCVETFLLAHDLPIVIYRHGNVEEAQVDESSVLPESRIILLNTRDAAEHLATVIYGLGGCAKGTGSELIQVEDPAMVVDEGMPIAGTIR